MERKVLAVQAAERRKRIAEDWINGLRQQNALAVRHGVSEATISLDLRKIFDNWRKEDEMIAECKVDLPAVLRVFDEVQRLAMDGFKRSQQNREKVRVEYKRIKCPECKGTGWQDGDPATEEWCGECDGDGEKTVEDITREYTGQAGDPTFLRVVSDAVREQSKLKGLYPEKKQEPPMINVFTSNIDITQATAEQVLEAKILMAKVGGKKSRRIEQAEVAGGNDELE